MGTRICYVCDRELPNRYVPFQLCSSIMTHNRKPLPEKLAEVLGENYAIIISPNDYICIKCSECLKCLDKMEIELQIIKDAFLYLIMKKHEMLPPGYIFRAIGILDDDDDADQQEAQGPNNYLQLFKSEKFSKRSKHFYKCSYCPFKCQVFNIVNSHEQDHIDKKDNKRAKRTMDILLNSDKKTSDLKLQTCSLTYTDKEKRICHTEQGHNYKEYKNKAEGVPSTSTEDLQEKQLKVQNDEQEKCAAIDLQGEDMAVADEQPTDVPDVVDIVTDDDVNITEIDIDELISTFIEGMKNSILECQICSLTYAGKEKCICQTEKGHVYKENKNKAEGVPSTSTEGLQEKQLNVQNDVQEKCAALDLLSNDPNEYSLIEFVLNGKDNAVAKEQLTDMPDVGDIASGDEVNMTQEDFDTLISSCFDDVDDTLSF